MENTEGAVEQPQPAPAAEEPIAEVSQEASTDAPAAEAVEETPEQTEAKKQSKFQRRLERQKTARIAAETEARLLRERISALEAAQAPKQQADAKPRREDFNGDDEAYIEALTEFKAREVVQTQTKAEREAQQQNDRQSKARQSDEAIAESWTKREAEFKAVTKDYEEVATTFAEEDLQHFADGAKRLIVESDVGPQVLYHLATHPEEAERIADLSPLRQVAELGKLEDRMTRPARRTSNAPPPVDPVRQGKTGAKDITKMTVAELKAHRIAEGSRWIRA